MRERHGWDVKLAAVLLVLGLPIVGVFMVNSALTAADETMFFMGLFLILLFPLVITLGILRGTSKARR